MGTGSSTCKCCAWLCGGDDQGKKTDKDAAGGSWLEQQHKVPLVSARFDSDEIGSDAVVTKTVVMRSHRPDGGSSGSLTSLRKKSAILRGGDNTPSSSPRKTGLRPVDEQLEDKPPAEAVHASSPPSSELIERMSSVSSESPSSCMSSSFSFAEKPRQADDDQQHHSHHYNHLSEAHSRHSSVEEILDQQVNEDDAAMEQPSPRSPKAAKSPKAESPTKKRYGRKNYHSKSSRRKNT